jgi:hypothetical protein
MKDKDTLFLESMYILIAESKRVENELKTRYDLDDETIKELFTLDQTSGKTNALIFGKWLSQNDTTLDELKELCAKAKTLEGKHPEVKNIQQIKTVENFKRIIGNLEKKNSLITSGLSKEQVTKLLGLDKTPDQKEATRIAEYIKSNKDLGIDVPADDVIREYERFLQLREDGVEGSASIEPYADYAAFTEFLHMHGSEDGDDSKILEVKVDTTPIVDDEVVSIWDTNSIQKCVKVGNDVGAKLELRKHFHGIPNYSNCQWCITYPLGSPSVNLYSMYRFKPTEWSFYMVWSKKRKLDDYRVFSAIAILKNGKYTRAFQPNSGGEEFTWEQIVEMLPELAPYKDSFKHHPLTPEERQAVYDFETLSKLLRGINENNPRDIERVAVVFDQLTKEQKRNVISLGVNLPVDVFKNLDKSFKNLYIETLAMSFERVAKNSAYVKKLQKEFTPAQLDRYHVVHDRALEADILGYNPQL